MYKYMELYMELCTNIWNYIIIQYIGDQIYAISEINISGKYLRLKKRLSIFIQQHTTLRFNKDT
jgi:hypothetical protein